MMTEIIHDDIVQGVSRVLLKLIQALLHCKLALGLQGLHLVRYAQMLEGIRNRIPYDVWSLDITPDFISPVPSIGGYVILERDVSEICAYCVAGALHPHHRE